MDPSEIARFANGLLMAAGLVLSIACAYLVRRPSPRAFRAWARATVLVLPVLLLGWVLVHPELGVSSVYRGLTGALPDAPPVDPDTLAVPRPMDMRLLAGTPTLAPSVGAPGAASPTSDDGTNGPDAGPPSTPPSSTTPSTPPTSPSPPTSPTPTETTTPPTPTETTTPPTPTETITPPTSSQAPPPPWPAGGPP